MESKQTKHMLKTFVITRSGNKEKVSFDKILERLETLAGDDLEVNPFEIAKETIKGIYDNITTKELDTLSADISATKTYLHPDYNKFASRITVSNLHKQIPANYLNTVQIQFKNNRISNDYYNFVLKYEKELESMINYDRDYNFDYFGFKTLERSYLDKVGNIIVERPQHAFMRVSIQIHGLHKREIDIEERLALIKETYDSMSNLEFTHASPTIFNSGTNKSQLSSCFLLYCGDDLGQIFDTIKDSAMISKWAGGIGISISDIRAKGTLISGTGGTSNGIVDLCKTFNQVARYINQGGRRKGSIATYIEPYHADIFDFIDLKKPSGDENMRARDLFLALWIPDLFMKRVQENGIWSLMCPKQCPGLTSCYGEEFEKLYCKYESEKKFVKQVNAIELWNKILENQFETGTPYLLSKDACNAKSNQKNLGIIKSSNLCVSGDTFVLTRKGQIPIKNIVNEEVEIWNGFEWSKVVIKKTSESAKLIEVTFNNGIVLKCTPEHKFYITDILGKSVEEIRAKDLKPTNMLINFDLPNPKNFYIDLKERTEWITKLLQNNIVKITDWNIQISTLEQNETILKLQTVGIQPGIEQGNLLIYNKDLQTLKNLGIDIGVILKPSADNELHNTYITSVKYLDEPEPTYCFTEPIRHYGIFNGILTGQCSEIVQYTDSSEIAVCNLGSICLPKCIENEKFNFDKLQKIARILTRNLDKVIDVNFYPVSKTQTSNFLHRPIGIGVQGLNDVYRKLRFPFESEDAKKLNKLIFENIYFACLSESVELAKKYEPYQTFKNSPFEKGQPQWALWGLTQKDLSLDWSVLIENMKKGVRNSLLTAIMPTATTSQMMGNTECIEPITSNLYVRQTLAGEYTIVNEQLVRDLIERKLWTKELYEEILYDNGSIQKIKEIPQDLKELYKTAYEIKQSAIIQQAADRGPFIDQSQSMNLFISSPDFVKLSSCHFASWKAGLKTFSYYLRTRPVVDPVKFGLDITSAENIKAKKEKNKTECIWRKGEKNEDCEMCSS